MRWTQAATAVRWDVRPFVDGAYRNSAATEHYEHVNPATEAALYQVPVGDATDIDQAVQSARRRFNDGSWSELPPVRRAELLERFARLIESNKDELALRDTLEMGKPIQASLRDSGLFAPGLLRSWIGFSDKLFGQAAPLSADALSFNTYEPRGVVGAITPWNFPCVCAVLKFGPAMAAGNTVVLKPSELSPSSALRLAELALEAGIPEGVLNVVPGLGRTVGAALAQHPDVDLISFTGSTATGRLIMELSGRSNGKPLLLECGGKSPHVVFADVDHLDGVADAAAQALLANQGQVCSAHARLIAHEDVKERLLEKVVERVRHCAWGDPLDEEATFGPLASPVQRSRVKGYIDQGLKSGARPVLKGPIKESGGCYVSPTIFDCPDPSVSIAREEIFGPVLCVLSFKTEQEAVALANGTQYGLAATVWTRDLGVGRRMAHAIKAGGVSVRTSGKEGPDSGCVLSYEPQRASGFGSERGLRGLQSYSTLKIVEFGGA